MNNVINKYLTESKIKMTDSAIKKILKNPKSGKYEIDGNIVDLRVVNDTLIISYPTSMVDFTYKLAIISDELGYDYTQTGMNKKITKFIVDLS